MWYLPFRVFQMSIINSFCDTYLEIYIKQFELLNFFYVIEAGTNITTAITTDRKTNELLNMFIFHVSCRELVFSSRPN